MATEEEIDLALSNKVISAETALLLKEYNERLQNNNVPIIYNLRHLRRIFRIRKREQNKYFGSGRNEYHCFKIPKKSGGMREIVAPSDKLKSYQLWIKENILDKIKISDYATGFKKACSILDNAKIHVGKELVINLDLKDFFPSIKYSQVYKIFSYLGYTNEVSHLLTQLCTNKYNILPQGSPASPILSNIVTLKLDKRLSNLAKAYECSYSRYADDITFSGSKNIKKIIPLVKAIIHEEGFEVNENKLRFQYNFQRQEVTGLVVNKCVKISPKFCNMK
jgi:Retron-type reverse transcriptase